MLLPSFHHLYRHPEKIQTLVTPSPGFDADEQFKIGDFVPFQPQSAFQNSGQPVLATFVALHSPPRRLSREEQTLHHLRQLASTCLSALGIEVPPWLHGFKTLSRALRALEKGEKASERLVLGFLRHKKLAPKEKVGKPPPPPRPVTSML